LELGDKADLLVIGNKAKGHGKTAPGKTLLSQNDTSVAVPVSTRKEIAMASDNPLA
jgi:hypothetical protein